MKEYELGLGGGTLTQIANPSIIQMMSYIIDTENGHVIFIDGGTYDKENAKKLKEELNKRGNKVDMWFITHNHDDHHGALTYLWKEYGFLPEIGTMYLNFPPLSWSEKVEGESRTNRYFNELLEKTGINVCKCTAGDIFTLDKIKIKVLSSPEDYEDYPNVNSTSLILKVFFPEKEVLFLGDFDRFAEKEYIEKHGTEELRCDICQMAHHGQKGVTEEFYGYIAPKYCLYTAPKWLWENNMYGCNDEETVGKGPFTTLETRKWMEKLGVKESFSFIGGDILFR